MKSNTNDTHPVIRYLIMGLFGAIFTIAFCCTTAAQEPKQTLENEWVETNTVVIPEGLEIFSGITRNGNPKYWFEIENIKVFISPINKEHYINGTAKILLVEWYNKYKDIYKYTTRQAKQPHKSNKINLDKI